MGWREVLGELVPETAPHRALQAVLAVIPGVEPLRAPGEADPVGDDALLDLGRWLDGMDRALSLGDPARQIDDAVTKALALAWAAKADPEAFLREPAGRAAIAWWAAVDVALVLPDDDAGALLDAHADRLLARLAQAVGEERLAGVTASLAALRPTLEQVVRLAHKRRQALTEAVAPHVPGLVIAGPSAGARAGAFADHLPVYLLLMAHLRAGG